MPERMAEVHMHTIAFQLGEYHNDCKRFPSTLSSLAIRSPGDETCWKGPYYAEKYMKDPWKHDYRYRPNTGADVFSLASPGQDGEPANEDDIVYADAAAPWRKVYSQRRSRATHYDLAARVALLAVSLLPLAFIPSRRKIIGDHESGR
jgi:hypothetical protein